MKKETIYAICHNKEGEKLFLCNADHSNDIREARALKFKKCFGLLRTHHDIILAKSLARKYANHSLTPYDDLFIVSLKRKLGPVVLTPTRKNKTKRFRKLAKTFKGPFVVTYNDPTSTEKPKHKPRCLTISNVGTSAKSGRLEPFTPNVTREFDTILKAVSAARAVARANGLKRKHFTINTVVNKSHKRVSGIADTPEVKTYYSLSDLENMRMSNKPAKKAEQLRHTYKMYHLHNIRNINLTEGFDITHFKAFCEQVNPSLYWPLKYYREFANKVLGFKDENSRKTSCAEPLVMIQSRNPNHHLRQYPDGLPEGFEPSGVRLYEGAGEQPLPHFYYLSDAAADVYANHRLQFLPFMRNEVTLAEIKAAPMDETQAAATDEPVMGRQAQGRDFTLEEMKLLASRKVTLADL